MSIDYTTSQILSLQQTKIYNTSITPVLYNTNYQEYEQIDKGDFNYYELTDTFRHAILMEGQFLIFKLFDVLNFAAALNQFQIANQIKLHEIINKDNTQMILEDADGNQYCLYFCVGALYKEDHLNYIDGISNCVIPPDNNIMQYKLQIIRLLMTINTNLSIGSSWSIYYDFYGSMSDYIQEDENSDLLQTQYIYRYFQQNQGLLQNSDLVIGLMLSEICFNKYPISHLLSNNQESNFQYIQTTLGLLDKTSIQYVFTRSVCKTIDYQSIINNNIQQKYKIFKEIQIKTNEYYNFDFANFYKYLRKIIHLKLIKYRSVVPDGVAGTKIKQLDASLIPQQKIQLESITYLNNINSSRHMLEQLQYLSGQHPNTSFQFAYQQQVHTNAHEFKDIQDTCPYQLIFAEWSDLDRRQVYDYVFNYIICDGYVRSIQKTTNYVFFRPSTHAKKFQLGNINSQFYEHYMQTWLQINEFDIRTCGVVICECIVTPTHHLHTFKREQVYLDQYNEITPKIARLFGSTIRKVWVDKMNIIYTRQIVPVLTQMANDINGKVDLKKKNIFDIIILIRDFVGPNDSTPYKQYMNTFLAQIFPSKHIKLQDEIMSFLNISNPELLDDYIKFDSMQLKLIK